MTGFFQHVINGLSLGAIYALIALGYTMVYGVLKLINFAHGDVFMVGAMMAFYASSKWSSVAKDPTIAGAIIVSLVAMAICGLLGFAQIVGQLFELHHGSSPSGQRRLLGWGWSEL